MAFVLFNLAAVAALVGIDQAIKLWAVNALQPVGAMPFIPHVVELRFVLNQGMAFSLLSGKQLFLIIATSAARAQRRGGGLYQPAVHAICSVQLCGHLCVRGCGALGAGDLSGRTARRKRKGAVNHGTA